MQHNSQVVQMGFYKNDIWLETSAGDRYVVIEPADFVVGDPVSELPEIP